MSALISKSPYENIYSLSNALVRTYQKQRAAARNGSRNRKVNKSETYILLQILTSYTVLLLRRLKPIHIEYILTVNKYGCDVLKKSLFYSALSEFPLKRVVAYFKTVKIRYTVDWKYVCIHMFKHLKMKVPFCKILPP